MKFAVKRARAQTHAKYYICISPFQVIIYRQKKESYVADNVSYHYVHASIKHVRYEI